MATHRAVECSLRKTRRTTAHHWVVCAVQGIHLRLAQGHSASEGFSPGTDKSVGMEKFNCDGCLQRTDCWPPGSDIISSAAPDSSDETDCALWNVNAVQCHVVLWELNRRHVVLNELPT